jgi:anti-sigma B factor antagonist
VNFSVSTERVDDSIAIIDLKGEVDLYTAPEFKNHLLKQIEGGVVQLIVDFSDTTFIDSTTLGVLVGGVKRLRPVGGQLVLVCADRNILKIFEITGLHRVFDIHSSREDALEAVRSGAAAG